MDNQSQTLFMWDVIIHPWHNFNGGCQTSIALAICVHRASLVKVLTVQGGMGSSKNVQTTHAFNHTIN